MDIKCEERRAEVRTQPDAYHSVEFEIPEADCLHQFKIWNVSSKGSCLLVRDDSDVLKKIEVGDVFDMKFYPADLSQPPEKTCIQSGLKVTDLTPLVCPFNMLF